MKDKTCAATIKKNYKEYEVSIEISNCRRCGTAGKFLIRFKIFGKWTYYWDFQKRSIRLKKGTTHTAKFKLKAQPSDIIVRVDGSRTADVDIYKITIDGNVVIENTANTRDEGSPYPVAGQETKFWLDRDGIAP